MFFVCKLFEVEVKKIIELISGCAFLLILSLALTCSGRKEHADAPDICTLVSGGNLPVSAGTADFFASVNNLSILSRREVRDQVSWYLGYDFRGTVRAFERSRKFVPMIKNIFDKDPDVPSELIYLPLLESGFNPLAVSKSNAKGLWQFVSVTAGELELIDDSYLDERSDIRKSTRAAVRHLKYLYSLYDNWEFALAAYNGGAGYVGKIIASNPGKDFWTLAAEGKFRRETALYVPRFAALLVIQKNLENTPVYEKMSFRLKPENFIKITVSTPASVSSLAKQFDVDEKTIREFNPQLKGDAVPPYMSTYAIFLPNSLRIASLR